MNDATLLFGKGMSAVEVRGAIVLGDDVGGQRADIVSRVRRSLRAGLNEW